MTRDEVIEGLKDMESEPRLGWSDSECVLEAIRLLERDADEQ